MFYHPISTKDKNKLHQFSSKVAKGIFIGCALNVVTGNLLVSDAEEVKDNNASEIHVKRFK